MVFRILILKDGYENSLAISKSYPDQNLKVHTVFFIKSGLLFNIFYCPCIFVNKHFTFTFRVRKSQKAKVDNKLHKRCLRIVYCIGSLSYEELFEIDESVSLHH